MYWWDSQVKSIDDELNEVRSTAKVWSQQPDEGIKIPGWAYRFATLRTLTLVGFKKTYKGEVCTLLFFYHLPHRRAFGSFQPHEVHPRAGRCCLPAESIHTRRNRYFLAQNCAARKVRDQQPNLLRLLRRADSSFKSGSYLSNSLSVMNIESQSAACQTQF